MGYFAGSPKLTRISLTKRGLWRSFIYLSLVFPDIRLEFLTPIPNKESVGNLACRLLTSLNIPAGVMVNKSQNAFNEERRDGARNRAWV